MKNSEILNKEQAFKEAFGNRKISNICSRNIVAIHTYENIIENKKLNKECFDLFFCNQAESGN